MATTSFTNLLTLTDAAWFNDADKAAYAYLTGVSGTNTIAATGSAALSAYAAGVRVYFIPANTNTGATTINITQSGASALGARNVFFNGVACVGGELRAGVPVILVDDGTRFHIVNESRVAVATVAAHATTMNPWVATSVVTSTSTVTFTDIADAPYAGAVVWVKMHAAHTWDDGAVFNVQGNADYTCAVDDWVRIYATTVSTFEVTIFKSDGSPVSPFVDTNPIVVGSSDATKKIRIEVDGLTTATTRVLTPPDADITILGAASKSDMETATSTTKGPTAATMQNHPGVAKGWAVFIGTSANPITPDASYGISGNITKNGTGDYTVTWSTAFSSANYAVLISAQGGGIGNTNPFIEYTTKTTTTTRFVTKDVVGAALDLPSISVLAFGDQ